jgi:hypothetical protein
MRLHTYFPLVFNLFWAAFSRNFHAPLSTVAVGNGHWSSSWEDITLTIITNTGTEVGIERTTSRLPMSLNMSTRLPPT